MKRTTRLLTFAACSLTLACGGPTKVKTETKPDVPTVDPASIRPAVPPMGDVKLPTPTVTTVGAPGNRGIELIVSPRRDSPAVHFRWLIPGGRALEHGNEGRNTQRFPAGTMSVLAEMLQEGTAGHRGTAFAAALERHGASVEVSAASDAFVISGKVLSHQLEPLLKLLAETFEAPELDAKTLETRKQQHAAQLVALASEPRSVASRIFNRVVYGGAHPYGAPGLTAETVTRITRRHLTEAHRAAFAAGGSSLVVVGDIEAQPLAEMVGRVFAKAMTRSPEAVGTIAEPTPEPEACHVFEVPDAVQSVIVQGNPGAARGDAAWPQLVVANQILGGSASSRLFTVLRERKGLTYGIYSSLDGRRRAGDWSLSSSVRTPKTAEALDAIATELSVMRSAAPTDAELTAARRFLVGQFVLGAASSSAVASRLAAVRLYDLPEATWDRYAAAIESTSPDAARAAAQRMFGAKGLQTVVVGDIGKLRPALDARCHRIDLRDVNGERVRTLVGPDDAMTDADRKELFAFWAPNAEARTAIARFVADDTHRPEIRAALIDALRGGPLADDALALGSDAKDWPSVATALLDRLIPLLRDDALDQAASAKAMLLDLAAPKTGSSPLDEAGRNRALVAISTWAFAGVGVDSATETVKTLVEPRLKPDDLARLGPPGVNGLEALVSADVYREAAALALIGLGDGGSVRAMVRAYRRALVVRRVLPSARDLELLGRLPDVQTALLLLDCHALLELSDRDVDVSAGPEVVEERARARRATMAALRDLLETMATTRSKEAGSSSRGSVLDRDIRHIQGHLEAVLDFRDADDRWWAATLLIRHRGADGLRLVLNGLADDDRYADPRWHQIDPTTSVMELAQGEIAPIGVDVVRPQLLAVLAGRHRMAKVLAVATMRVWGDDGSITALRTHVDATDVATMLGLDRPTSVTELARAAVDANRLIRKWDQDAQDPNADRKLLAQRRTIALGLLHLTGAALEAEVERRVNASKPATPTAPAPGAPGAVDAAPTAKGTQP